MKELIVNADDLGVSPGINRGIFDAHGRGIVTSASLMVDMPYAAEAVEVASQTPGLGLGLHVVLTREDGQFLVDPEQTQLCRAAIALQLSTFEDLTSSPPSHLDAHHNVYRDPRLLPVFRDAARERAIPLRENSAVSYFPDFYGQWDGETHLDQVGVESLLMMLKTRVGDGITELGCHPGFEDGIFESPYLQEREEEVRTLCHPRIRAAVEELGIKLTNYRRLGARALGDGQS